MASPPLSDELCLEALRAVEEHGSKAAAARALGIPQNTFRNRYEQGQVRGLHLSEGFRDAITQTRTLPREVKHGWIKETDPETGRGVSLFVKNETTPEEQAEKIRGVFSEPLPPAEPVAPPETVNADLCTVHPLMDVHLAMHAWPDETGAQSYSLKEAARDMAMASAKIDAMTPQSARAVLLIGGDFFHGDDETAQTPRGNTIAFRFSHTSTAEADGYLLAVYSSISTPHHSATSRRKRRLSGCSSAMG